VAVPIVAIVLLSPMNQNVLAEVTSIDAVILNSPLSSQSIRAAALLYPISPLLNLASPAAGHCKRVLTTCRVTVSPPATVSVKPSFRLPINSCLV